MIYEFFFRSMTGTLTTNSLDLRSANNHTEMTNFTPIAHRLVKQHHTKRKQNHSRGSHETDCIKIGFAKFNSEKK